MKLFLIKLGKSWQVLQRDGLINGSRRIANALFQMFRPVGKGDVLFISGGVGDSARYRTTHVAEELELTGLNTQVTVQDNPFLLKYVTRFSVFIFHRVLYTEHVAKMIGELKEQKKTIIFETDDLVYDPKFLVHMDYYTKMNSLERKLYDNGVGGEILRDEHVTVATTTTTFLAEKLRAEGKESLIVLNKLSQEDVSNAEDILKKGRTRIDTTAIRIGYFSGTISHNKDFATITGALMYIMEIYENVELVLVGPLDVESEIVKKFGDRVWQLPYVARKEHFRNIASVDINIVPLEVGNPFCESKSELKFFEAGIMGVPTVASGTQTFQEAIQDGVDGFTAVNDEEWKNKLSELIEDASLRRSMGNKAREIALKKYTTKCVDNEAYYQYLQQSIRSAKDI